MQHCIRKGPIQSVWSQDYGDNLGILPKRKNQTRSLVIMPAEKYRIEVGRKKLFFLEKCKKNYPKFYFFLL